jgi:hypothetical protein
MATEWSPKGGNDPVTGQGWTVKKRDFGRDGKLIHDGVELSNAYDQVVGRFTKNEALDLFRQMAISLGLQQVWTGQGKTAYELPAVIDVEGL